MNLSFSGNTDVIRGINMRRFGRSLHGEKMEEVVALILTLNRLNLIGNTDLLQLHEKVRKNVTGGARLSEVF